MKSGSKPSSAPSSSPSSSELALDTSASSSTNAATRLWHIKQHCRALPCGNDVLCRTYPLLYCLSIYDSHTRLFKAALVT